MALIDGDKFQETLESLNETQQAAVLSDDDTLQILAGPGSGKTRVLTVRVAYLVLKKNIEPRNIVVVTFTNKAANEMIQRLQVLIGAKRTKELIIGTFHSICCRLLRRFGGYIGLKTNFTIIEPSECEIIITEIKKDKKGELIDWTAEKATPGTIFGLISKAKSQGISSASYAEQATAENDAFKKDIANIYTEYELQLEKNNLVDFDNLLMHACKVLRTKKDALANVQAILVDEYQDTNIIQYDLIKLIAQQKTKKAITIVGDPDQSIFGWRSAEPKNFMKMQFDFKTMAINMEQNYRSTGTVLKAALHVITQDRGRIDKSLYTNNVEGVPIALISTANEDTQAQFVAKEIKRVIKYSKGLVTYKDIAVLMRMNFISQKIEDVFRRNKIPFSIIKGDRFFERIEVKDILSYLRFAYNPRDSVSFKRIVNVPKRSVGDVTLKKILAYRDKEDITLLEALERITTQKGVASITGGARNKLADLFSVCQEIKNQIKDNKDVSDIIDWTIHAINYEEHLKQHYKQDFDARWANLSELVSLAKDFNKTGEEEEEEEEDSSVYVSSQNPDSQQKKQNTKDEGVTVISEEDIIDDDEPDEVDEVDLTSMTDKDYNKTYGTQQSNTQQSNTQQSSQGFSSQNTTQTQQTERSDILNQAFKDDFNEDDEPVYKASKSPLEEFLEYCALCSNQKELEDAEGGKVTVATMHSSKGLEWPCVFILTCNESIIPASRGDVHEEGRLLYVGMTRSKFLLYCISPRERNVWGHRETQRRSRFLDNMDKKLYIDTNSQWNNSIRRALAVTIRKPVPEDDDRLRTVPETEDTNHVKAQLGEENAAMDIRFAEGSPADLNTMGGFTTALSLSKEKPANNKRSQSSKAPKKQKRTKK